MSVKHALKVAGRFVSDSSKRFAYLAKLGVYSKMGDEEYLSRLFLNELGYPLNLEDPKTFNEKMQWLKLNAFRDVYTDYADKVKVKPLIAKAIGGEYVIPTFAVWDRAEDIDLKALPESFVMKCNHTSSAGVFLCHGGKKPKRDKLVRMMRKGLSTDYYSYRREPCYRDIERKIIAEEFIEGDGGGIPEDFKVYVFNGRARILELDVGRFGDHKRNFYDREWGYIDIQQSSCFATDPRFEVPDKIRRRGPELLELAEKVTSSIDGELPFLRVDFYLAGGRIYFGEATFYDGAGFESFRPDGADRMLGDMIDLGKVAGKCLT